MKYIILLIAILAVVAAGCTDAPAPDVDASETNGVNEAPVQSPEDHVPEESSTEPTIENYGIGDTASDGLTKITLNDVRYATVINENDDEFWTAEVNDSEKFVILDITLENISPDRTRSYGYIWHFRLLDGDGYTYENDFDGEMALSNDIDAQNVLPGQKRRGEMVYRVPDTAEDLQLQFMFDPKNNYDGIVFDIE